MAFVKRNKCPKAAVLLVSELASSIESCTNQKVTLGHKFYPENIDFLKGHLISAEKGKVRINICQKKQMSNGSGSGAGAIVKL